MLLNRFRFLLAHLKFDEKATREERWKQDRFALMRDIFQIFTGNCEKLMPEDFLSLDETLHTTRVGVAFRQYNKNKPTKHGLLF